MSIINRSAITLHPLSEYLTEYKELNTDNKYRPVAVGRYGIRTRESIYSKELAKDYSKNKLIYKGTLTVGMGSVQMDIGILSDDTVYSVSPAYHTYRIAGIDYDYLRYCLHCRNMDMFARYMKRGSRQGKSIDLSRWIAYEIPVYPAQTQAEIVVRLDTVQRIIDARRQELAALDDLIKARFVEMFGDPRINPNNYPVCQLSEHIAFLTSGSRGWAQYCVDDGVEWFITIKNVKECRISIDNMQPVNAPDNAEAKRTKVQEGDLLISITADLGRTGVVTREIAEHGAYINQHLTCIRLNRNTLNPLYVAYFMESPAGKEQFESKNQSAVKAGLNFNSINSLRLMVPPMDEQNDFVEFVAQVDKSKLFVLLPI
ncbi:MAG: restriction endonuclease subunit S [Erysipelotrichaceae bacterium]|nr:restriction endonuclease subunit S [Erysipelotrichaceae bacterium]